jgi:hypothetical protein
MGTPEFEEQKHKMNAKELGKNAKVAKDSKGQREGWD